MSIHRTRRESSGQIRRTSGAAMPPETDTVTQPAQPTPEPTLEPTPQTAPPARVPHTRTGAAWVALIGAALLAVLLIVFLVQNTRSTEISFLWMTTSTPLAVALLIAAVGSVLLTLILGTARITQLRRLIRKQRT
jgi:putative membrane protein